MKGRGVLLASGQGMDSEENPSREQALDPSCLAQLFSPLTEQVRANCLLAEAAVSCCGQGGSCQCQERECSKAKPKPDL